MHIPLPPNTQIVSANLKVADITRALAFYTNTLGFHARNKNINQVALTSSPNGQTLIQLTEQKDAQPKPPHTTGLFHIAIRVPSRAALSHVVQRLHEQQWPLLGASDHGVSEAIYLNDPEGNGLEIYTDLPQAQWPTQGEHVAMYSAPLNVQTLLQESTDRKRAQFLPANTDIGHIHLQVSSLETARNFYCNILGFDVRQDNLQGALFVAANGYHHHLGLNTWAGLGIPSPPENAVGLQTFTISIPNTETHHAIAERLSNNQISFETNLNEIITQDPDHNTVIISLN